MNEGKTMWSKETLLQRRSSKMRKWSLPILRLACWSSTREGAPGSRAELHYRTAPARAFARYSILLNHHAPSQQEGKTKQTDYRNIGIFHTKSLIQAVRTSDATPR